MTTSPDRPFLHVTDDDVTVTRTPTPEQAAHAPAVAARHLRALGAGEATA